MKKVAIVKWCILILAGLPLQIFAQISFEWGFSGRGGAGTYLISGDDDIRQGVLLPTYGASFFFEKSVGKRLTFRPSLGFDSRGGSFTVEAPIINNGTPISNVTSLGGYKSNQRDSYVSSDIKFHYLLSAKDLNRKIPYLEVGFRNDFYLYSNYRETPRGDYFQPVSKQFYNSPNYNRFVSGAIIGFGLQYDRYEAGLEYYCQITNQYKGTEATFLPVTNQRANVLALSLTYRIY